MLEGLLSGLSWFVLFLLIHIIWFHFNYVERCGSFLLTLLLCCTAGHAATFWLITRNDGSAAQSALGIVYGILVMVCLFILYMPFYYTIATSLSVQSLIFLETNSKRSLTVDDLREHFASREIVAGRLAVMALNGYLREESGRYFIAPKGHRIAVFFSYLKDLWKLGPGG